MAAAMAKQGCGSAISFDVVLVLALGALNLHGRHVE